MSRRPRRIAALGYYGFGNLGDEAVLAGIRQALGETIPETDFLVLSNHPQETRRLHPGVQAADRWKWKEAVAALRGTDLFILGGGSLLQDATSVKSVIWYALMALIARRRSRRVLWWGQGIGPLQSTLSRTLVRRIAGQADALTVRDLASAKLLHEIGVRTTPEVVADPAFALDPVISGPAQIPAPCIFAPRPWKGDTLGAAIGQSGPAFWKKLEAITGAPTLILPMHLPGDADYVRALPGGEAVPVSQWNAQARSVVQTLGLVSQARLMIAMRLHALIFAARCGIPFVPIVYDPKVTALSSASGQEDVQVPVELLTQDTLRTAVERSLATEDLRRGQLQDFASAQAVLARRPARIADELLA